ncbi:ABC transporter ATP-binding protein (plasmid) [Fulvitalea axinellae]|uniref:ABC transporter ATP-binding protein n=1 Tax=Fulvitalea axinellae TaxID=1182444 RepID=A0AAU9DD62_9BACT|nr:ABC transporter ATP-binding protein [Fulvitalea axinellae]
MSDIILSAKGLSKRYGSLLALTDFGLELKSGQVYGVLGPNGSGKTTALGILLGTLSKNSGEYSWFGQAENDPKQRRKIGAMLEAPSFNPNLSGVNNLKIVADIKSLPYSEVLRVLGIVGLGDWGDKAFGLYSLGMKQRLALAVALLGSPEVLILDEPTNGLDPTGIAEVRDIIKSVSETGVTILLASHLLDEVQKVCTHTLVLSKGQTLYSGTVEGMLGDEIWIETKTSDEAELINLAKKFPAVNKVKREGGFVMISISDETYVKDFSVEMAKQGVVFTHFNVKKGSLEEQFLKLLKNK